MTTTRTPTAPARRHRWTTVAALVGGLLLGPLSGVASAHVSVVSPGATQGGYTKVTFRVPTERDAPTTRLEVAMPTDTPIASVRVQPHDGWTYEITTAVPVTPLSDDDGQLAEIVTRVVWTATGAGIAPGEFEEFNISAGPLPDTDQVVFKVLQTYGDGDVVAWIEEPVPGVEEPEHPAPVLALAPADADPAVAPVAAVSTGDVPVATVAAAPAAADGTATTLAVVGLVLGGLALTAAGYAVLRMRRTG